MDLTIAISFCNRFLETINTYIVDKDSASLKQPTMDKYPIWNVSIINDIFLSNYIENNNINNIISIIKENSGTKQTVTKETSWDLYVNSFFDIKGIVEWDVYTDSELNVYYHNPTTNETQYECPIELPEGWSLIKFKNKNNKEDYFYSYGTISQYHCPLKHVNIKYKQQADVY